MDKVIRLGAVLVILLVAGWFIFQTETSVTPGTARITTPDGFVMTAGLARTPEERMQGLSGRENLLPDQGLLFLFPLLTQPSFWMKSMRFPIDILWMIDERLIGFEQNAQPENPPTTYYIPKERINRVLEVPAGFVEMHQLRAGDRLDIEISNE